MTHVEPIPHGRWFVGPILPPVPPEVQLTVPEAYDRLANTYDHFYAHPRYQRENFEAARLLFEFVPFTDVHVLDIGCGTGLFAGLPHWAAELQRHPDQYVGVDPSLGMLYVFATKHPHLAAETFHGTMADYAATGQATGFDLVVSLFGSPSYLSVDEIRAAFDAVARGGRIFLMFYRPGYHPWYEVAPDEALTAALQAGLSEAHGRSARHDWEITVAEPLFDDFVLIRGARP